MVGWMLRLDDIKEINVEQYYDGYPTFCSIKLFYGGEFTKFPGRKYVNAKQKYVDAVDIEKFTIHDIDKIMRFLGCVEEGTLLFYHFKVPLRDLDFGLHALASDQDINHLKRYVEKHKMIEVYIEHGITKLHTYSMSPNHSKVRIVEFRETPSCSRRLLLTWKNEKTGECSGSTKECENPQIEHQYEPEPEHEKIADIFQSEDNGQGLNEDIGHEFDFNENIQSEDNGQAFNEDIGRGFDFNENIQSEDNGQGLNEDIGHGFDFNENIQSEENGQAFNEDNVQGLNDDIQNEASGEYSEDLSDSDDSDFYVDEDNIIDDVPVDMKEFLKHIDKDVEWVGDIGAGSSVNVDEGTLDEEVEVINNDVMHSESSSDEGNVSTRRKSIRAIRRAHENSQALVTDPFYVYQTFATSKELKDKIRLHAIETRREISIIKNDKNRVRAICNGTIPDLGQLNGGGPNEPDDKCPWVLYASKWKQDADWEVITHVKEHRCLQTRNVKQCTYNFLSKQVTLQVESNPQIPTRALQDQLQREYQVDISKMKAFRAKTAAMNLIRGDYAGQYSILRDYILELQTRNPQTTVKLEVETEGNPASETRIFKRIYICLGSLKKGFLAGKRDYLGLDGAFIKGPYPGQLLTAVGLDVLILNFCNSIHNYSNLLTRPYRPAIYLPAHPDHQFTRLYRPSIQFWHSTFP